MLICSPAAIQKKTIRLPGQLTSNDSKAEKSEDGENENINMMDVDLADVAEEQSPESNQDPDLADGETEASVDTEASKISEEIEPGEVQAPADLETGPEVARGKRKLQVQGKWRGVDPVVFFRSDTIVNGIKAFYGIEDSFPFRDHLVTRNSDTNHVKRIYYISKSVKDILELNFLGGQQLKITSIGLKMFVSFPYWRCLIFISKILKPSCYVAWRVFFLTWGLVETEKE